MTTCPSDETCGVFKWYEPPSKVVRANLIAKHLSPTGNIRVVAFTCGNAARAMEKVGLDVLAIGPHEGLIPGRWWTPYEILRAFPDRFDATPGHLPMWLMVELGKMLLSYQSLYGGLDKSTYYLVPTGSGETILSLHMAAPALNLFPVYDISPSTEYHPEAPLTEVVAGTFPSVYRGRAEWMPPYTAPPPIGRS